MFDIKGFDGGVIGHYDPIDGKIEDVKEKINEDDNKSEQETEKEPEKEPEKEEKELTEEECSIKFTKLLNNDINMPKNKGVFYEYPMTLIVLSIGLVVYSLNN